MWLLCLCDCIINLLSAWSKLSSLNWIQSEHNKSKSKTKTWCSQQQLFMGFSDTCWLRSMSQIIIKKEFLITSMVRVCLKISMFWLTQLVPSSSIFSDCRWHCVVLNTMTSFILFTWKHQCDSILRTHTNVSWEIPPHCGNINTCLESCRMNSRDEENE